MPCLLTAAIRVAVSDENGSTPACSQKCLPVADLPGRSAAKHCLGQVAGKLHSFGHSVACAIPLDHRELGIMQRALFALPKYPGYLINRLCAGGKQAFHGEFGRGLQPHAAGRFRRR